MSVLNPLELVSSFSSAEDNSVAAGSLDLYDSVFGNTARGVEGELKTSEDAGLPSDSIVFGGEYVCC